MQNLVLVVDDDQPTLLFMEHLLRPIGAQIIVAEDGKEAIELLGQYTPGIIFLDMLLPRITGMDVLDFILNTPRLSTTYVAVISAHNHFKPNPQLARVDRYFVKPVRAKEVRDLAQYAISRQTAS
jgi:CheY-like chemotaxis protein